MENPNTWTLLHHDLARASNRTFSSTGQKAEALLTVLENHRVHTTHEEVLQIINDFSQALETGICGKSLIATLVDTLRK